MPKTAWRGGGIDISSASTNFVLSSEDGSGDEDEDDEDEDIPVSHNDNHRKKNRKVSNIVTEIIPVSTAEAQGIPAEVVHSLMEAVLSAAVCFCGKQLLDPDGGCSVHGCTQISWYRILPVSKLKLATSLAHNGVKTSKLNGRLQAAGPAVENDTYVVPDAQSSSTEGEAGQAAVGKPVTHGLAFRRQHLIEILNAISAASRWSHTREELTRHSRVGVASGAIKGLASLLEALCARMSELRQRWEGPVRGQRLDPSSQWDG